LIPGFLTNVLIPPLLAIMKFLLGGWLSPLRHIILLGVNIYQVPLRRPVGNWQYK
jgi:hypothetical protein